MRKYYFLNKFKKWQGPYLYFQILYFCLKGDVKPNTFLWHNKLSNDFEKHPLLSIYARKKASELQFLPIWVFGSNIKTVVISSIKKWKKILKKENDWQKIFANPIENSKLIADSKKVYLIPSLTAIHDFTAPGNFTLKLNYFDRIIKLDQVRECPINLSFDPLPGLRFEIIMNPPLNVNGVLYKESYGLHNSLLLVGLNENISINNNSTFDFYTKFPYIPQILKGRFKQANLVTDNNYINEYNRLIVKVIDDNFISPQDIIGISGKHIYDHDKFNVHSSLMGVSFKTGGRFTEVNIDKIRYNVYSIEDLIIIDGLDKESLKDFKKKAEVIRIALGILSGKFYGGDCHYVTSNDENFQIITGIWYELEKETVVSNRRVIDLVTFRSTIDKGDIDYEQKYEPINKAITPETISRLCSELWDNESLLHAANLIISGMGNKDPLQQGALYSVALETLTSIFSNSNSKRLNPIQEKPVAKQFVNDLKSVLSQYEDKISKEGVEILSTKIELINSPTNKDKLTKTFELYGIAISTKDKDTINKRNDYLHGRNPLSFEQAFELNQISLRLHTLIVSLLLKSIGYSGHIINLDTKNYLSDEDRFFEQLAEEQKKQNFFINQITQSIENNDNLKAEALKKQLIEYLDNSEILNLIRII